MAPELTDDYKAGQPWYGSDAVVDKWASWLKRQAEGGASGMGVSADSSVGSSAGR